MSFNWRSNYKLPLSFIVLFVLFFFLLGEQLPALPIYLLGPEIVGDDPVKLHILDLPLGDGLLHRPFAYLIIGTIIWILYRIFFWPLAWGIGAILWIILQTTLTPLDQRPTLQNVIIFTSTFWIVLTLLPYFIYKWVDQKWGGVGIRNVIVIVLLTNILVFTFFVLQIYFLNNSHRGLTSIRILPPNTCPEKLIIIKDKQTEILWNGKNVRVSGEEQNWVEQNCPQALENHK